MFDFHASSALKQLAVLIYYSSTPPRRLKYAKAARPRASVCTGNRRRVLQGLRAPTDFLSTVPVSADGCKASARLLLPLGPLPKGAAMPPCLERLAANAQLLQPPALTLQLRAPRPPLGLGLKTT
ncbi:hypothetical protein NDU88_000384 [Pleurodeles waltl]|uniref:Uncharacterized protein n=1 Tax=Pleurodeles waltl TaxID=8319 RepID=A0AAV7S806_PLEWA|nr:hypothetical protein NDU88_000384 [Pleurodeles waltl]